jgi:hypothetical protein
MVCESGSAVAAASAIFAADAGCAVEDAEVEAEAGAGGAGGGGSESDASSEEEAWLGPPWAPGAQNMRSYQCMMAFQRLMQELQQAQAQLQAPGLTPEREVMLQQEVQALLQHQQVLKREWIGHVQALQEGREPSSEVETRLTTAMAGCTLGGPKFGGATITQASAAGAATAAQPWCGGSTGMGQQTQPQNMN